MQFHKSPSDVYNVVLGTFPKLCRHGKGATRSCWVFLLLVFEELFSQHKRTFFSIYITKNENLMCID